jgi:hypothetical protein
VSKREHLGRLLAGWQPSFTPEFLLELLSCTARVVAFSANGDLYFVGRSPDSLFDFLSGVFASTSWEDRVRPLPVSLRWGKDPVRRTPAERTLRRYLAGLELAPRQIVGRERPTVLVDAVVTGRTFGELVTTWHAWATEVGIPWEQVRSKLRLIGITERTKTSPKTWRWQQHVPWAVLLPPRSIKNVSVPDWFCEVLASRPKASRSFPPEAWADPTITLPSRNAETLAGLREAVFFYETGRAAGTRQLFAGELARAPGMQAAWLRSLVRELRSKHWDATEYTVVPDDSLPIRADR